jgi:hypothetical protein
MYAVCYAGGTRNLIADLSSTGNSTQPQDTNPHLYILYYRGDKIVWAIDGLDNVVAQTYSGVPGPNVNTLPLKLVAIAGPVAPLSNGQLQCNVAFVGDTTNHGTQLADGTQPWQKAAVDSSGNLSVKLSAGTLVLGHVITDTGSTTTVTGVVTSQGVAASGTANSNNPVKVGEVFNTTQPTVINGQVVDLQATARGAAIVATGVDSFSVVPTVGGTAVSLTNPFPIVDAGAGAVTLIEQSALITAAASGSCTLAANASKTTYLRGFTITSAAATAIVSGQVTITGLTNAMNLYYDNLAVGQSLVQITFGEDGIPGSAINTAIVINFPAITGGAATAINMWGYQA